MSNEEQLQMKYVSRSMCVLLALLLSAVFITAQDDDTPATVSVAGSGIVNPLLEDLADASDTDVSLDVQTVGTAAGLEQLCTNEITAATASRVINVEEDTRCIENGVEYAELLLGHDIVTFIGNPEDDFLTCLTSNEINTLFAPSAEGNITQWSQLTPPESRAQTTEGQEPGYPELNIAVQLPQDNTLAYVTLDAIVSGIGLRGDVTTADATDIIDAVSSTSGAIGVVPLQAVEDSDADVMVLDVNFADVESGCEAPSAQNIEDRLYTAATPLLLYVKQAELEALTPFLNEIASAARADVVRGAGFTPATTDAYETNQAIISGEEDDRAFSLSEPEFEIPPGLTGELVIGGASAPYALVNAIGSRLGSASGAPAQPQFGQQQQQSQGVTVNVNTQGEVNDVAEFCAGELDMVLVQGDSLSDDEQALCDENSVVSASFPLGAQAAILVINEADDYAVCLTVDQIATIWGADSTDEITNWNQVSEAMPDQEMTLFGIAPGNVLSDILLNAARDGAPAPVRIDTEQDRDPLYRAAAVGNVPGGLTYMSWQDYQDVLENEQENIQPVTVDNGDGCVVPGDDTISSGEYPLSVNTTLLVSQDSLATPVAQAYLWTLYSDENFNLFEQNNISGVTFGDLADIRDDLLVSFQQAEDAAQARLEAPAEATPEATEDAP
jgi:phosphate transport system substrate-binding protein